MSPDHPVHRNQPWTQQSRGCERPGDFIYLPKSFLGINKEQNDTYLTENDPEMDEEERERLDEIGLTLRNEFLKYRYGVFAAPDGVVIVGSRQHALCSGRTVQEVVNMNPDLLAASMIRQHSSKRKRRPKKSDGENKPPQIRFTIAGEQPPKYMLVLENSLAMDDDGNWDRIRRAAKKFVLHDVERSAHLGLVLFNEGAYVAEPAQAMTSNNARQSVAVNIGNKFALVNKNGSCVRCGVVKAIEGLQTSQSGGGAMGGTVVLISQGISPSLGSGEERELMDLARKHRLRIFSLAVPRQPQDDISMPLERLCHNTGGASFFVPVASNGGANGQSLATYVRLVDAFREVQARTSNDGGPYLVSNYYFFQEKVFIFKFKGAFNYSPPPPL